MSEATASDLSGLPRGFYGLTKIGNNKSFEHLMIGKAQADSLVAIQANTFHTVVELKGMAVDIKGISKNTKPGQSGRDMGICIP